MEKAQSQRVLRMKPNRLEAAPSEKSETPRIVDVIRSINSKSIASRQETVTSRKRVGCLERTATRGILRQNIRVSHSPHKVLNDSSSSSVLFLNKTATCRVPLFEADQSAYGDFVKLHEISRSCYAAVHLGIRKSDQCVVAIKVYKADDCRGPSRIRHMLAEVEALKALRHSNVVQMLETVDTPTEYCIVMEYVQGKTLSAYLRSQKGHKLTEPVCKHLFQQLVEALAHCHQHQVAHRDVKLENVLVTEDLQIKLVDFGFSTLQPANKKTRTLCGTPAYMAPELVKKQESCGPPVDIWALGVVLYSLLCGRLPFKGQTEKELFRKVQLGKYVLPKHVSAEGVRLIAKLLKVNPEERPTAQQLLVEKWLRDVRQ